MHPRAAAAGRSRGDVRDLGEVLGDQRRLTAAARPIRTPRGTHPRRCSRAHAGRPSARDNASTQSTTASRSRHVEHRRTSDAAERADLGHGLGESLGELVAHRDLGAEADEREGDRLADPLRRARHRRSAAVESDRIGCQSGGGSGSGCSGSGCSGLRSVSLVLTVANLPAASCAARPTNRGQRPGTAWGGAVVRSAPCSEPSHVLPPIASAIAPSSSHPTTP